MCLSKENNYLPPNLDTHLEHDPTTILMHAQDGNLALAAVSFFDWLDSLKRTQDEKAILQIPSQLMNIAKLYGSYCTRLNKSFDPIHKIISVEATATVWTRWWKVSNGQQTFNSGKTLPEKDIMFPKEIKFVSIKYNENNLYLSLRTNSNQSKKLSIMIPNQDSES